MKKAALLAILMSMGLLALCSIGQESLGNEMRIQRIEGKHYVLLQTTSKNVLIDDSLLISRINGKVIANINSTALVVDEQFVKDIRIPSTNLYFVIDTITDEEQTMFTKHLSDYWFYLEPGKIENFTIIHVNRPAWKLFGSLNYETDRVQYGNGFLQHLPAQNTSIPWFPVGILVSSIFIIMIKPQKLLRYLPLILGLVLLDVPVYQGYGSVFGMFIAPFIVFFVCCFSGLFISLLLSDNHEVLFLLIMVGLIFLLPFLCYGFTWHILMLVLAFGIYTFRLGADLKNVLQSL
ncbi:MAG: hypothetical protein ACM3PZ_03085 [Bacillota bacterium]